ncbi:MAG: hypothetical protein ACNA8K_00560 [Cyclonatronaceae bacterium]
MMYKRPERVIQILLTLIIIISATAVSARQADRSYEILPAPDLWYNDTDGIRVGLRLRGQVPGTFNDGPHRLDLGIWLGTWFPTYPVSYFLRYTEPVPAISDFNSEGSISVISTIRTGFHRHALRFDKRWQEGFNEDVFREIHAESGGHRRFSHEYVPFPSVWQSDWIYYLNAGYEWQKQIADRRGLTNGKLASIWGLQDDDTFIKVMLELNNKIEFGRGFGVHIRGSGVFSSKKLPSEYGLLRSMASPVDWMNSGFTRAKGTIPTPWMESGAVNIAGGPSLRGYNREDIKMMKDGLPVLYRNMFAVNAELDYPNPLDRAFSEIPVLGEFLRLRSYVFYDGGAGLTLEQSFAADPLQSVAVTMIESEVSPYFSDIGAGFMLSLNIPDYLGKPRGFVIRYEIPFWLSHPENGQNRLRYRGHLGIGAVIGL